MYAIDHEDLGTPASRASESVTVRIDGLPVTVPAGTSIMRAAALAGSRIPKLCATDTLKAFGSCRLPGGDRGPQGLSGVLHDTGRRRNERAHAD